MDDEHAARFDGPFIVTCAVPGTAAAAEVAPPTPSAGEAPPALMVDDAFESALCRPHATLGGWDRR
jgi:hypothetical protein